MTGESGSISVTLSEFLGGRSGVEWFVWRSCRSDSTHGMLLRCIVQWRPFLSSRAGAPVAKRESAIVYVSVKEVLNLLTPVQCCVAALMLRVVELAVGVFLLVISNS